MRRSGNGASPIVHSAVIIAGTADAPDLEMRGETAKRLDRKPMTDLLGLDSSGQGAREGDTASNWMDRWRGFACFREALSRRRFIRANGNAITDRASLHAFP
jgi:hypothetical protein